MIISVFKHLFKYIIFGVIIYLLLTYIPKQPLDIPNQTIMFIIALTSFIIIDLIVNYQKMKFYLAKYIWKTQNLQNGNLNGSCNCSMEKFTETQPVPPIIPEIQQPITVPVIATPQQVIPSQPIIPSVQSNTNVPTKEAETSEMKYTELPPEMHQPLGTYDNTFTNDFDHGYTYLNTDKWSVPMRRPPVCIQEKECPVCPTFTTGTNMELKDFPMTVNYPEKINVNYIQDKMNKMR
jgi:hypothetical protein